jgi:hypothetical protein
MFGDAADERRRTFVETLPDVAVDTIELRLAGHRAHVDAGLGWIADLDRRCRAGQRLRKLIGNATLHQDADPAAQTWPWLKNSPIAQP